MPVRKCIIFMILCAQIGGGISCSGDPNGDGELNNDSVDDSTKLVEQRVIATGLPLIKIVTDNYIEPTCDYVSAPEGCMGRSITNCTKVPGHLKIKDNKGTLYDSGDFVNDESGMTIRLRGNTSAYYEKKPYKIKLQKKADLLFRDGIIDYKDKDWVLIDYNANIMIGLKLNEIIGLQWTPRYKFVNLILNNQYKGVYVLMESVKRNKNCRLDVENKGYIAEYDAYWWNEDVFVESHLSDTMNFTFKYPKEDNMTEEDLDYFKSFIDRFEYCVVSGNAYEEYIDVNSLATWVLAHDILGFSDAGGNNIFMTKYDNSDSTKFVMANLWDFDGMFGMKESLSAIHLWQSCFIYQMFVNSDSLRNAYQKKYSEIRGFLFDDMLAYLDVLKVSNEIVCIEKALELEHKILNHSHSPISTKIELAKMWFITRKDSLDKWIN